MDIRDFAIIEKLNIAFQVSTSLGHLEAVAKVHVRHRKYHQETER